MAPTVIQKRKKKRLQRTLALIRPDALQTRKGNLISSYHFDVIIIIIIIIIATSSCKIKKYKYMKEAESALRLKLGNRNKYSLAEDQF